MREAWTAGYAFDSSYNVSMPPTDSDNLDSRRGFLRRALRGAGRAAGAMLGADLRGATAAPQLCGWAGRPTPLLPNAASQPVDPSLTPLRPPGPTADFELLCRSCGRCAQACAHGAIRMMPRAAVVASLQPCRMCQGFPCARACPAGAQAQPEGPVRMGIAIWAALRCPVATNQECDVCRTACPAGAISLADPHPCPSPLGEGLETRLRIRVDGDRCTGCGVCEYSCPQRPRAIYIDPL